MAWGHVQRVLQASESAEARSRVVRGVSRRGSGVPRGPPGARIVRPAPHSSGQDGGHGAPWWSPVCYVRIHWPVTGWHH